MFDLERWQEIFDTILKNKLRTFLTGLSVASGIFILVILLGFGQGMQNGIEEEFKEDATTSIWVWPGVTRIAYQGLNPGRRIQLRNGQYDFTKRLLKDEIEYQSPRLFVDATSVTYDNESLSYRVQGVSHEFQFIENEYMVEGRFLNHQDEEDIAKVAVIGNKMRREAFSEVENIIGDFVKISGVSFKIIGVYGDLGGNREEERIFIPISTAQKVFNGSDRINNMNYTLPPSDSYKEAVGKSIIFKKKLLEYLQSANKVHPDDTSAVRAFSAIEEAEKYYSLIRNIKLFFWFVGVCTIIAGVVGVSNIMLIVVKERTKEIGIRKALGAKPWAIIGMILHESVFVTTMAGFSGLILSMGLLQLLEPYANEIPYVLNPTVNFEIALTTVFILIFAGALAGFFPARRAAMVQPIEALRDE